MTTNTPSTSNFQQTLKDMWDTRPPRIPKDQGGDSHVAGVCEGLGARFQLDPTIFRVIFVISGLFGGGIAVYFLAWMIMPRYSLPLSPLEAISKPEGKQHKKERELGWWLVVGTVIFWSSSFSYDTSYISSSSLVATALACVAWYFLHLSKPVPPAGLLVNQAGEPGPDFSSLHPMPGFAHPYVRTTPPDWDPLGVAPFAWHLPEPGPAPAPKKQSNGWRWVLGLAGAGAAVVIFLAATNQDAEPIHPAGDFAQTITKESELQDTYDFGVGNADLDFSNLAPLTDERTVNIDTGVGNVDIYLPKHNPVKLECDTGVGNSNCVSGTYHTDADGKLLTIHVDHGVGNVTIHN
ncbi:PspC domain-containing protein [Staphylococcus chromogenes]|nr:PspC domain-containing protein [Staphylococcus chromogenes]